MWFALLTAFSLSQPMAAEAAPGRTQTRSGARAGKPKVAAGWKTRPYAQPVLGASSFSNGEQSSTALWGGARAGLFYHQVGVPRPRIRGEARVQGATLLNVTGTRSYDLRVGNFIGPQWKHLGLSVGPDLFYNQTRFGTVEMPGTAGVGLPAVVTARVQGVSAFVGAEPAWYLSENRAPVDWSQTDAMGFGDEFSWLAGVGMRVQKLDVGLNWRRRTTRFGTENSYGVNFTVNGLTGCRRRR